MLVLALAPVSPRSREDASFTTGEERMSDEERPQSDSNPDSRENAGNEVVGVRRWRGVIVSCVGIAIVLGVQKWLAPDTFWRSIAPFLREAAVLVSVFSVLDPVIDRKPITAKHVLVAAFAGLTMLAGGNIVDARMVSGQAAQATSAESPAK